MNRPFTTRSLASFLRAAMILTCIHTGYWAAHASTTEHPHEGVDAVLDREPGGIAPSRRTLRQSGTAEAGGVAGRFNLDVSLADGRSRLSFRSGPMVEESGWDWGPWTARHGAVTAVGLPAAIADAAAERYLRRYGWRDLSTRRYMQMISTRASNGRRLTGVSVSIPGAAKIDLWFDAAGGRLVEAVTQADMGPLTTVFADWRGVAGAEYAFHRAQRDATGQTIVLAAETTTVTPARAPARTISTARGRLSGPLTLPFSLDHGDRGHIVVRAGINGRPASLIFDTGAANYLTPSEARRYGLSVEGGLEVGGIGESSSPGGYARVAELNVGGARLIDTLAIVADLPDAATHPAPGLVLQGLTGSELLAAFEVSIDYGARTIAFAPFNTDTAREGTNLPLVSDGQALFVEASVEGHRGWFRLDTGDPGTLTLFPGFARMHGFAADGAKRTIGEVGGTLSTRTHRFADVTIAGRVFRGIVGDVSAQSAGAFSSRTTAGNLGAGLLSCFVLRIDTRRGRTFFKPLPSDRLPNSCAARARAE